MKGLFLSLSIITILGFSACTKKVGPVKACFNFSKNPAKVNDTVYLLNCSENYAKFKWLIPTMGVIDSINKHNIIIPTATGSYPVGILVWDLQQVDTIGSVQILTVN